MKASIAAKLDQLSTRLAELDRLLADPDITRDMSLYRRLSREHAEIAPIVSRHGEWRKALNDEQTATQLLTDRDLHDFAMEELAHAREHMARLEADLMYQLLPRDPDDERNIFLEIRAGTGGDESALFAGDLLRMYLRHAERHGWAAEIISASQSELGGYKEVICRIAGQGAYARMKFESGTHRVQRVPATEAQGRIHTSACTVAVLPESEAIGEVDIQPAEIRIDTFRSSGAGGQHINKTDSAVRIVHLPTGIVVECQSDRSQHKNKAQALSVLAARIRDQQLRTQQASDAAARKSLVGSGDRSERIRTYNFPQGRVTDHRINLTLYRLEQILDGDLDELTDALITERQAEQLAAMGEEA